jgi:hypothetical protein
MLTRSLVFVPALLAMVVIAGFAAAGSAEAQRSQYVFNTQLRGETEVHLGDMDARGKAQIKIDTNTGMICYSLRVKDIGTITGAHIHQAPPGVDGPVVQGLTNPMSTGHPVWLQSSGCVSNPMLAAAIVANPHDYYVNVHTAAFPAGAVRGNLH